MDEKRRSSVVVPYKVHNHKIYFFLQKRTRDARISPGFFCLFGGGAEASENPEEALLREIQEELTIVPTEYTHFKQYKFGTGIKDVFVMEVGSDFEQRITVSEGEYGKWFTVQEALSEEKLSDRNKVILQEVSAFLQK
jgi:8-oxo-dGTP diphosphatase